MLFGAMQRSQKLILPTVAGERKRESETESSRKVTHTVRHPAKIEPFLNCVIQQLMSWFRWFQRSYAPQLWPCIHCDTWTCRIADMEVYLSSVLPKIQFTSKRVVKDVCVCVCVCVWEAPRAQLSSFWEQRHSVLQAGPSPSSALLFMEKRGVYGLNRWCQDKQPKKKKKRRRRRRRSHDSFPKPWKRAKGQTNQWQFGWYLAPSIDRPRSVWHECKCEKCSFLYVQRGGPKRQYTLILSWLTWLNTCIWSS